MRICLKTIITFFYIGILFPLFGQDEEVKLIQKYAETSYSSGDYEFALENYLKLYENNKDDIEINFRVGVCYTMTNVNPTGGIPYLQFVVGHNNFPPDAYYYLGKAYMFSYQFTSAVEAFYEYKAAGLNDELLTDASRLIDMSYSALEFINVPLKVTYTLLDTAINSGMNDFNPFILEGGEYMVFASDYRYIDELEMNISDLYMSRKKGDVWEKAVFMEGNTYDNEEIVGTSSDGDQFFIYSNGDNSTHDLFLAELTRKGFERNQKDFPADKINTEYIEHGACSNATGNVIYFASNRPGGFGGLDIYKIERNEEGIWGEVENLGANVNTPYDDNFPSLAKDEGILYFASKGHRSIGGYDLFQVLINKDNGQFVGTRGLGVPLNTPYDNTSISFIEDGKLGYMTATRKEGLGKLDVYRVVIDPDASNSGAIIQGSIMVGEPDNAVPYSDAFNKVFATLYDKFGNIQARYPLTEDFTFLATVPPGDYILDVYLDGSDFHYREELNYLDTGEQAFELKTVYVKP